jgi:hypothetical protein
MTPAEVHVNSRVPVEVTMASSTPVSVVMELTMIQELIAQSSKGLGSSLLPSELYVIAPSVSEFMSVVGVQGSIM